MKKVCLRTHRLSWITSLNHRSCGLLRLCSHQGIIIISASGVNPRQYFLFSVILIIIALVCGSPKCRASTHSTACGAAKRQKKRFSAQQALSHFSILTLLPLTEAFWRILSGDSPGMGNLMLLHMERRWQLRHVQFSVQDQLPFDTKSTPYNLLVLLPTEVPVPLAYC